MIRAIGGNSATPQNIYGAVDNGLAGPAHVDSDTLAKLTTYAEEADYAQTLVLATQASGTDMMAATPTQGYIDDTRNTLWAISQNQFGYSSDASLTANLVSAQCVNLPSTRIRGSLILTNTTGAEITCYSFPNFYSHLCTAGLKVGQNGVTICDVGEGTNQMWRDLMFDFGRNTDRITRAVTGSKYTGKLFEPGDHVTSADTMPSFTVPANGQSDPFEFSFRPNINMFNSAKLWPPNLPLQLLLTWTASNSRLLFYTVTGSAPEVWTVATGIVPTIRLEYITSEEVQLNPSLRDHILTQFTNTPSMNINAAANLIRRGGNGGQMPPTGRPLLDNTFGISNYNPERIAAIYQYIDGRLNIFNINGQSFTINPVNNGSARPSKMLICISPKSTNFGRFDPIQLQDLQVFYDGRALWHKPLTPFELYVESCKALKADPTTKHDWFTYATWLSLAGVIVVDMAPSHNENEIQPSRSTQITIVGNLVAPVTDMAIRTGLYFDQTLVIFKNSEGVLNLPIQ